MAFHWLLNFLSKPLLSLVVQRCKAAEPTQRKPALALSCDSDFRITEVQPELCRLLRYTMKEMIGMSVFKLMSTVVADAHAATFRRLRHAGAAERAAARKMNHLRCRDSIVIDADGNPIACRLTVQLNLDLSARLVFERIQGKLPNSVPRGFGQYIRREPGLHLADAQEAACIMTDIANSTSFSKQQSPRVMAELLHKVYVTASTVVEKEALPYVYIHEVVGDRHVDCFVSCADGSPHSSEACFFCATQSSWRTSPAKPRPSGFTLRARCKRPWTRCSLRMARKTCTCVWASLPGRFVPELWTGGTFESSDQPSTFRSDWSQCARARESHVVPTSHRSSRSRWTMA
ncbi:unnamed protein product [Effrenium voratum]|uniref:LOV domain-containing protein n=1 Tax=Effrenium voratum TaxID=2562239 RepID=A0AA36JAJ1_9DINO|nr:unnamed protein product [Effrenium voratum]